MLADKTEQSDLKTSVQKFVWEHSGWNEIRLRAPPSFLPRLLDVSKMAGRRQAFHNNPELQRFVLHGVRSTGRQLGVGSYGSVKELEVNGLVCAGKRLHEALLEQGNAGVAEISRKYLLECQVTSIGIVIPLTNFKKKVSATVFQTKLLWHSGNGRDAAPTHCAVPWAVFPRRVSTASAGDGTTGQQPG